jgi:hypothetical protein
MARPHGRRALEPHRVGVARRDRFERGSNLVRADDLEVAKAQAQVARRAVERPAHDLLVLARRARVGPQDGDATHARHDLLEQRHDLADRLGRDVGGPGDVAAGASQARDQAGLDREVPVEHDDRNRSRRLHRRADRPVGAGDDDVHARAHQSGRELGKRAHVAVGPPPLDDEIAPHVVAALGHRGRELLERRLAGDRRRRVERQEPTRRTLAWLRANVEREASADATSPNAKPRRVTTDDLKPSPAPAGGRSAGTSTEARHRDLAEAGTHRLRAWLIE